MSAPVPRYVAIAIDRQGNQIGKSISPTLPTSTINFTISLKLPELQSLDAFSIALIPALGDKAYLNEIYKQLDFRQRVEIYEGEPGGDRDPIFTGTIEQLPANLNGWTITGQESLENLGKRSLHHFQTLAGNIETSIRYLLNTWEPLAKFNFNVNLSGWTPVSGSWNNSGQSYILYQRVKLERL